MSISIKQSVTSPNQHVIHVDGKLNFCLHKDFQKIYDAIDSSFEKITLDLEKATHIDSSGIGIVMHLHDLCNENQIEFSVIQVNSTIEKIIKTTNLQEIINIQFQQQ